jgi:DNA recombination protein RmuC
MNSLLILIIGLLLIAIVLIYLFRNKNTTELPQLMAKLTELQTVLSKIETNVKEDFRVNREETASIAKSNREELNQAITTFRAETTEKIQQLNSQSVATLEKVNTTLEQKVSAIIEKTENSFKEFGGTFEKSVRSFNELQREKFAQLENKQNELVQGTEKKLESIRTTVEEKLEKTLSERLGQSFEVVGKQLIEVQKGLGEMQTLAQDVGGLKKVLSNVKMRGGIGEVQLSLLLDQLLAPDQYQSNVKTKKGEDSIVEFAIKLPGRDAELEQIWLPIDAKFPKDKYEQLQEAYDTGDITLIQQAQKTLEDAIKSMAKDICQKYLNPPATTDFGIMFLPFEGIYAEVVRKASLLEDIQREYKVIITGPSTLAAILNSLQMGFRTLAIQKRSSEVWQVLGAVKKEFENFGGLLSKAQNNIQTGLNQLDDVMGVRTRAINKKLKSVTVLPEGETKLILPDVSDPDLLDEETEN